jgi:hypothetical protein
MHQLLHPGTIIGGLLTALVIVGFLELALKLRGP